MDTNWKITSILNSKQNVMFNKIRKFAGIKFFVYISACLIITGCQKEIPKDSSTLFPYIEAVNKTKTQSKEIDLPKVFVNSRIIPLETNQNSIIGGFSPKTIKNNSHFYVQSTNDVVIFNDKGEFTSRLSKVGSGPEEYPYLLDFDVVDSLGEIWISSNDGIMRYDRSSLEFKGKIDIPFAATKFKYINDSTIIAKTPEDITYCIFDIEGKTRKSFYEKNIANNLHKPLEFIRIGNLVVAQLSDTNSAICYDIETDDFSIRHLIAQNDRISSPETNDEYMEKYGYLDMSKHVDEDFIGISALRAVKDFVLVTLSYPDKSRKLAVADKKSFRLFPYFPSDENTLKYNLSTVEDLHPLTLNTLITGESDDSFLFLLTFDNDIESNPQILEVFDINIPVE